MPPSGAVSSASATRTRVRSSPSTTSKKGWYTGRKVMIRSPGWVSASMATAIAGMTLGTTTM
jgi:hypothetical protein